MLDGFLARRWGVESKFGARLDSLADFVFVLAVGYKLFPWLKLPTTLWMMIGLIALVKVINAISSFVVKHRVAFFAGALATRPTHQSQQIDRLPAFCRHDDHRTVILRPCSMDNFLHRPLCRNTGRSFNS